MGLGGYLSFLTVYPEPFRSLATLKHPEDLCEYALALMLLRGSGFYKTQDGYDMWTNTYE